MSDLKWVILAAALAMAVCFFSRSWGGSYDVNQISAEFYRLCREEAALINRFDAQGGELNWTDRQRFIEIQYHMEALNDLYQQVNGFGELSCQLIARENTTGKTAGSSGRH